MKIKTITCHNVYNYGASLQAYALMKYLQNLGHDVEIIDYRPDYLSQRYNLFAISPRVQKKYLLLVPYLAVMIPLRMFKYYGRKKKFNQFTNQCLSLTKVRFFCNKDLKMNPPLADVFIAGSDQIWNTSYPNGKDPAFYLDFAFSESVKASYAASFSISTIQDKYKEFVKEKISKIDYVSVREKTGLNILSDLGIDNAVQVLDPVFLLSKNEWSKLIPQRTIKKDYILIYDFESNPLLKDLAVKLANENKMEIVSVTDGVKYDYVDRSINNAGPLEFLSLIQNSSCFISNSFHGTAFSVLFEKQFYVLGRMKQKVNSRMQDFISSLDLSGRYVVDLQSLEPNVIDYEKVNKLLGKQIDFSRGFLKSILKTKE